MSKMVLGVFSNPNEAERAVTDLERLGYDPKDLSIIMRDHDQAQRLSHSTGATVAEGAASGATTGAVVGGIAGLLIGIGAIAIPGIGAILIGGPIAAALGLTGAAATTVSGAATGAVAGGLIGALTGLGVSDEDARVYEDRVKAGGVLVAVPARGAEEDDVVDVMERYSAHQVRTIDSREETRLTSDRHERDYDENGEVRYHHR